MAEGLRHNEGLKTLSISCCEIADRGVEVLGNALMFNKSLKKLSLYGNSCITEKGLSVFTECLEGNDSLEKLYLPWRFHSSNTQKAFNAAWQKRGLPLKINVECK